MTDCEQTAFCSLALSSCIMLPLSVFLFRHYVFLHMRRLEYCHDKRLIDSIHFVVENLLR